ncbi:MAG: glutamine-hydrolyzing carbamoyl-phosphate synthase small subunit [Acidilobaceae archaeon]
MNLWHVGDVKMKGYLVLEDGLVIEGEGFGSPGTVVGEVVFSTAQVGYPESLTDPSYRGQILILSHPMIGNYGVPDKNLMGHRIPLHFESEKIQVAGLVISTLTRPSHYASVMDLNEWLKREGVPGLQGVDTRMLIRRIRERGVVRGALVIGEHLNTEEVLEEVKRFDYEKLNFVKEVTVKEPIVHRNPYANKRVILIDLGVKFGILRALLNHGFEVVRIPYEADPIRYYYEYEADGVVVSNGPGNPKYLVESTNILDKLKAVIENGIPTLGICLGNQLISMSLGAEVFKLKYGHRGINKPVYDLKSGKGFVTTQNHGYAVDLTNAKGLKTWMINIDDKTVEGVLHENKPVIAVQFHPEASPGPWDSLWVFDYFKKLIEKVKKNA